MKKSPMLFYFSCLLLIVSCSKDENNPDSQPEKPNVEDTFKYFSVSGGGIPQLYEIGNNTGNIEKVGKIPGIEFNLVPNGVTSSKSHYYFYQQIFDPHMGKIYAYDKVSKQPEVATIDLSNKFGQSAVIDGLDWDEVHQNLIAIVHEDYLDINAPYYVVSIDPKTFEIVDLEIEFNQNEINSSCLKDGVVYVSSYGNNTINNFNKIDINSKTLEKVVFEDTSLVFTGLSPFGTSNKLFVFRPVFLPEIACASAALIDLDTFDVLPLATEDLACKPYRYGKGYYNTTQKEHVAIVNLTSRNPNPNALMIFNEDTKKARLVVLNDKEGDTNTMIIIDAIKL